MTDLHTIAIDDEDKALKAKHRAMWASGDYPALASDLIWPLGPRLVQAVDVRRGDRVLDVAAGTGNAAIPAALRGAIVTASDLTPELFGAGHRNAQEARATLEWVPADAEALPFDDDAFDVAMSCIGVMFAPHHERAAAELVRVTRPGGRIGVLSWTPTGFIGRMFAAMKPFNAPLPAGAQPAPLWGDEQHVRDLFGDRITDIRATRETVRVDRFATGEEFRAYFASHYGPTIAVCNRNADDAERTAALDSALTALGDAAISDHAMEWEYLIFTATVR
ncbi:class I SAM-dependent methyltransferase [Microbacterium immunditiarum]|uniref:SAM-dependent methyltransferase n=1 Tax=Microbacterium immunditiarum TaxID=337480 RepID=A0A7Y9KJE8_9MICO|nr:methyltransferase domain-containing protein [Microbacterium immunditiarum]NYE19720.1 SAM-dependent methyltransferase [Microbacterium immunditiarum]